MTTLADILADVKSDIEIDGAEYDAQIIRKASSALRRLRSKGRFWFLETFASVPAVIGAESVDIAATLPDFALIKSVDIIAGSSRYYNRQGFDLKFFDTLRADHWTQAVIESGRPVACAVQSKTLYLSHRPQEAHTFPLVYYKQDATLPTAAGDTSVWLDDGYDVVRALTQYLFLRDSRGEDEAKAGYELYLQALEDLNDAHLARVVGRA